MSTTTTTTSRDRLKTLFRNAGAVYVEIIGGMVCTSWTTAALADKAADTMRRAGITDIERGLDGSETNHVCTGWIA